MLLPTETWWAAWFWLACWNTCSTVRPCSASRCSSQVTANTSAGPWPCRRLANSATNGIVSGGFSRTISARTSTTFAGSVADTSNICSTQYAARSRSRRAAMTCTATRRRFSSSARRSMIGIAHNSPSLSGVTDWYAETNARTLSASTRPSRVRDQLQGDGVNPRVTRGRPVRQPGQLPAVAARQMPPGRANLLFDEVVVVEEPLGRGRDPAALLQGLGDEVIRFGARRIRWRRASAATDPPPSRGGRRRRPGRHATRPSTWRVARAG